jgi:hypothetical protein
VQRRPLRVLHRLPAITSVGTTPQASRPLTAISAGLVASAHATSAVALFIPLGITETRPLFGTIAMVLSRYCGHFLVVGRAAAKVLLGRYDPLAVVRALPAFALRFSFARALIGHYGAPPKATCRSELG